MKIEYEKELKAKMTFFASISWYYGASQQYRDKFDRETKVRDQIGLFKS